MDFWKWLSSERRIRDAMEQSVGHDLSPVIIQVPANTDEAQGLEVNAFGRKVLPLDYRRTASDDHVLDFWEEPSVKKQG